MVLRNLDIETFTAESEKKLEGKVKDFHNEHPDIEVKITTHRVSYNQQYGERHDCAIFYLN